MSAVIGMRCLFTRIRLQRLYPSMSQKRPSNILKVFENLYSTSWPPLRITEATRKVNRPYLINRPTALCSTEPSRLYRADILRRKRMTSLKTVEDELKSFDGVKNSADVVNRVTTLYNIAKITEGDGEQKQMLKEEREKIQQGQDSPYLELLGSISRDISKCQPRDLSNVLWALGKIVEKEHKLVEVCEKEILLCGIVAFNDIDILKIVNGCANLNLRTSGIFENVQEAILNGRVKIQDFEDRGLCGMLWSFCKTENGSAGIFDVFLEELSCRGISKCHPKDLASIMWALGKIGKKGHRLVEACEREILLRGIVAFDNAHICQIVNGCENLNLRTSDIFENLEEAILSGQIKVKHFADRHLCEMLMSFSKTKNGSIEMFDIVLKEILSRDFSRIATRNLAEYVWSFAKREFKTDELFDRIEEEILGRRTVDFHTSDLILITWAFATAEKGSKRLFHAMDGELFQRGVTAFRNLTLFQIVWPFAKRDLKRAKVFDLVEMEILDRGVNKIECHDLVLTLWSFVSAKRHDGILIAKIEGELCSRDRKEFDNVHLGQVAWSLGRAGWSDSKLFEIIEAEVFQRGPSEFIAKEKCMLMRGFLEAKRGSKEFFELVLSSFSAGDFHSLRNVDFCEFVGCFSKADVEAGSLFDALEREILTKEKGYFTEKQLSFIKWNFQKAGKGSKALFEL